MIFIATAISVRSPTYIQIGFTDDVGAVSIDNFEIKADRNPEDILTIYSVEVRGKVVDITCSPAFPLVSYTVSLVDGAAQFSSAAGELLGVDTQSSRLSFVGPEEANSARERMSDWLPSIYDSTGDNPLHAHISNLAKEILSASVAVKQTSNAAYIEEIESDTVLIRGPDQTDRLPQESAYQIDRVSVSPTGSVVSRGNFDFFPSDRTNPLWDTFPSDPYLLRQKIVVENVSNIETELNSFSGLILSVANPSVTAVVGLSLLQSSVSYDYDITLYPLILQSSRYDSSYSRSNARLTSNQIEIPQSAILAGHIPLPAADAVWTVTYGYDDKGISAIDTPRIFAIRSVTREMAISQSNVFSLSHFPIVDSDGGTVTRAGVSFLYPVATASAAPYASTHPAFRSEVAFSRASPPAKPGEYAVDYQTGQVLVFGEDSDARGTSSIPPASTYSYLHEFVDGIDFVLDTEADEIVAVQDRDLIGENVFLEYRFESVLVPDVDYQADVHNEVVDEYIENRFVGLDRIRTTHYPLTDVFSIYNETTGETYRAAAFSHNEITLSGDQLPTRTIISGEPAVFSSVVEEQVLVDDTIVADPNPIVRATFGNTSILGYAGGYLGSSLDSSLVLDQTLFIRERFFSSSLSLAGNVATLVTIGDFCVDYSAGRVYARVSSSTGIDLGTASYRHGLITIGNPSITSLDSLRYARSPVGEDTLIEIGGSFAAQTISTSALVPSAEQYLADRSSMPLILGCVAMGTAGYWRHGTYIFQASDALFTTDCEDGYHYLRLEGDSDRLILEFLTATSVRVDTVFTDNGAGAGWQLYSINQSNGNSVTTTYMPRYVRGVYLTSEVAAASYSATNFWDYSTDTVSSYTLTLQDVALDGYAAGTSLTVVYDFGTVFSDYERVADVIRVSYEWGDNQIRWIRSLPENSSYFVTYRYGALRRELRENFASMIGLPDLIDADMDFPRESIRDLTRAVYQVFSGGPTLSSLKTLGSIPTLIQPDVRELSFDEWTLERDHLFPSLPVVIGEETYGIGRWGAGLDTSASAISLPGEGVVAYRNGSFSQRVHPLWYGINNNAACTFDFPVSVDKIWIGATGYHPTAVPFTIRADDAFPTESAGRPPQFWTKTGLFVWFDSEDLLFKTAFIGSRGESLSGIISTDGSFAYRADGYIDGYGVESTDQVSTATADMVCSFIIDGYDTSSVSDGYIDGYGVAVLSPIYADSIGFVASKPNYFFDTGRVDGGRLSFFKDIYGFLTLRAIDENNRNKWTVSADIRHWLPGEDHTVGASWSLNSPTATDELHLFVDGREASNIIRWGGVDPGAVPFRSVAVETVDPSLANPIIYSETGISAVGSDLFTAVGIDFVSLGAQIGDSFTILDNTADGIGGPYLIVTVSSSEIQIDSALTLSLTGVKFSINQMTYALDTSIDSTFVIYADGVELPGPAAEVPAYSVERIGGINYLTLWGSTLAGAAITAETRGLTLARAKFTTTLY
jgi:hypothetical protein